MIDMAAALHSDDAVIRADLPRRAAQWVAEALNGAWRRDPLDVLSEAEWLERKMWEHLSECVSGNLGGQIASHEDPKEAALIEFTLSRWAKDLRQRALALNPVERVLAASHLAHVQRQHVQMLLRE